MRAGFDWGPETLLRCWDRAGPLFSRVHARFQGSRPLLVQRDEAYSTCALDSTVDHGPPRVICGRLISITFADVVYFIFQNLVLASSWRRVAPMAAWPPRGEDSPQRALEEVLNLPRPPDVVRLARAFRLRVLGHSLDTVHFADHLL